MKKNFRVKVNWEVDLDPFTFELITQKAIKIGFEVTKYPDATATVAEYLRYYGELQIDKIKAEHSIS